MYNELSQVIVSNQKEESISIQTVKVYNHVHCTSYVVCAILHKFHILCIIFCNRDTEIELIVSQLSTF